VAQDHPRPALRSDAERNRAQIIKAAREAFAESGLEVPMHAIARRAGVGIGTLYRRFPTRGALIAAAFEEDMQEFARAVDTALDEPDPWAGFCSYIQTMTRMQARDPGLTLSRGIRGRSPPYLCWHHDPRRAGEAGRSPPRGLRARGHHHAADG
jgi:AcrR family transcriptional regulator